MPKRSENGNWNERLGFVIRQCGDIKKYIWKGCTGGTLYDKNDKPYRFSKETPFAEIKNMVEEIRKTNAT